MHMLVSIFPNALMNDKDIGRHFGASLRVRVLTCDKASVVQESA